VTAVVVAADDAALGSGDVTRRWAVADHDGIVRWPGVTRVEADAMCAALTRRADPSVNALAHVELGVVLSDGAGPYLVDADGCLVLVIDEHPARRDWHIAMGNVATDRVRLGVARPEARGIMWEWCARAEVAAPDRIVALDGLAACDDDATLQEWNRRWARA
jgi:hypothetical protein